MRSQSTTDYPKISLKAARVKRKRRKNKLPKPLELVNLPYKAMKKGLRFLIGKWLTALNVFIIIHQALFFLVKISLKTSR